MEAMQGGGIKGLPSRMAGRAPIDFYLPTALNSRNQIKPCYHAATINHLDIIQGNPCSVASMPWPPCSLQPRSPPTMPILMPTCSSAILFQMDLASLSPDSGYSSTDASPPPTPQLLLERLFLELDHFLPPRELTWIGEALVCPPPPLAVRGEDTGFDVYPGAHHATLECHVTGPSGTLYAVDMAFVPELQGYKCLFRPMEIGLHVGVVMAGAAHLPGSPFFVNVARNYSLIPRSVVKLDVEMESEGRFLVRKPWGITSNSRTEEVSSTWFILNSGLRRSHEPPRLSNGICQLTNVLSLCLFWFSDSRCGSSSARSSHLLGRG